MRRGLPTPVGDDHAALPGASALMDSLEQVPVSHRADAVAGLLATLPSTPVFEERRLVDGVDCVATTFLAVHPRHEDQVLVHVNSVTDRHRENIAPAVMARLDGTDLWHLTWWLPVDLVASYRLAIGEPFPDDVGSTRPGWLEVHRRGAVDPRNPHRLPNPLGEESSVLIAPQARLHEAWEPEFVRTVAPVEERRIVCPVLGQERTMWIAGPSEGGRAERLLIAFDGDWWHDGLGLADVLATHDPGLAVVMVSSIGPQQRSAVLPRPDAVGRMLAEGVLPVVRDVLGALPDPEHTVVAGQSFGGLAAAGVVATRPDIALRAVVQSGSFQYKDGQDMARDDRVAGDVVFRVREQGMPPGAVLAVQWGSEEQELGSVGEQFVAAALAAGSQVTSQVYAGGHDYAWWRTGLLDAIDAGIGRSLPA
ncbi:enterochelin esterase domain-containing protein [Demequina sp.]|uniref:enterochelin esterase domain-containing protein n=1 Tax=Demequina sp. TaxID=2050685 RepID=UPI003A8649FD